MPCLRAVKRWLTGEPFGGLGVGDEESSQKLCPLYLYRYCGNCR